MRSEGHSDAMALGTPFASVPFVGQDRPFARFDICISECPDCRKLSLWASGLCVYPRAEDPPAHPDLPEHIRGDYVEACRVLDLSPRASAALLRLVVEKLCAHLVGPSKRLDDGIAALVKRGLDVRVQRALDVVRVVGNDAVHPGKMDSGDSRAVAEDLFHLVNLIVERLISFPKHIDDLYDALPHGARQAIDRRDRSK